MGCNCSEAKKGEDALLAEATKGGQNTVKKKPSSFIDENESGGSNGAIAKDSRIWYHEPEDKQDGDILSNLCNLIGDANKKDIEKAINNVKLKDDANAVMQYMINTTTKLTEDLNLDIKSKHERKDNVSSCLAFVRLTIVLEAYIKWMKEAKNGKATKSIYALITGGKLGGKGQKFTLKQILDDFHHLMFAYNTDEDFQIIYNKLVSKKLIISIDKSSVITRNYRDRDRMNEKQRKRLYFGYTESKEITVIQLLDRIYVYYAYSFQLGLRLTMREKLSILYAKKSKDDEGGSDGDDKKELITKDAKLICMSSLIKKKQINLENVIGKKRMETNKFVTLNQTEAVMFYYKEFEAKCDDIIEIEGKEYKEKDWWIKPKYQSLKEELLQNEKCKISPQQFDDLLILANLHCECAYNAQLRQSMLDLSTVESWGMNNKHVLALMAYCNFVSIQFELKQTYYRLEDESDHDLKKRHSILGNLGSLLKEVVCDYGRQIDQKSRVNTFYHSISIKSISTTLFRFHAPTSCSTSRLVVYNYSSITGTIIELNSGYLDVTGNDKTKYFDCSWMSDFGIEEEKLFIGQNNPLELSHIDNINTFENYQLFVFALNIITTAFGEVNESWGEEKKNPFDAIPKARKLRKLVKKVLERRASQVQPHLFGKKKKKKDDDKMILSELLEQFCAAKKQMMLFWFSERTGQHWPWIDDLLTFMQESVFCKELKGDRQWVKLDLLSLMFENLESVTIVDCPLNEAILSDIDLFIQKLSLDPKNKAKKKGGKGIPDQPDELKKDESEIDKLMDIDLDQLVGDLKSDKSHISFHDPNFDDLCDYRMVKMREIKILESYDQDNYKTIITDRMMRRYNIKFKNSGWEMYKGKIMGENDGFIFRKIGKSAKK